MENMNTPIVDKDLFVFVQENEKIKDKKFETKPVGFFKDCLNRFRKNKSSVVAAFIILILFLFAIIAPLTTNHGVKPVAVEGYYKKALPRTKLFEGIGWDGAKDESINEIAKSIYEAMNYELVRGGTTDRNPIVKTPVKTTDAEGVVLYKTRINSYYKVGFSYLTVDSEEYQAMLDYQDETGHQLLYPLPASYNVNFYQGNAGANYWYKIENDPTLSMDLSPEELKTFYNTLSKNDKFCESLAKPLLDDQGNYIPNYLLDTNKKYEGLRIEGDYFEDIDGTKYYYQYYTKAGNSSYKVRVDYYEYFMFKYGYEPYFIFGLDQFCCDIFTCLGSGARLSFLLAIGVSVINLLIGFIYGAIEGFYGGAADLIMERISDILASVPFIVVATLFQLHLAEKVGPFISLLFAFVLTGWIGIASTVRTQFYRFKNQEYVLAARTLGASDARLIFKHIFPNAMGTIITSCVLIIPGVIFSESILSYLGVVSFKTSDTLTSIGTMLSNGESSMREFPHIILFPTIFISLLEISFNLFGNGLRDAFNPSLRGSE